MLACLVTAAASASAATIIPNRGTLNALLGGSAATEDFDDIDIGQFPSWPIAPPGQTVDSSTHAIIDGVSFTSFGTTLTVRESGTGQRIQVGNQFPSSLLIDFSVPTPAFGFDYSRPVNSLSVVTLKLFAADDVTLLDTVAVNPPLFLVAFVGASDPAGIGSVEVTSLTEGAFFQYRMGLDLVTFGVPEPSTAFLVGAGLAALAGLARRVRRPG